MTYIQELGGDIGELMRKLDDFLKKKVAQGGLAVAGIVSLFTSPALGSGAYYVNGTWFCQ